MKIGAMIFVGFMLFLVLIATIRINSDEIKYKFYETCISAGGDYSVDTLSNNPKCDLP